MNSVLSSSMICCFICCNVCVFMCAVSVVRERAGLAWTKEGTRLCCDRMHQRPDEIECSREPRIAQFNIETRTEPRENLSDMLWSSTVAKRGASKRALRPILHLLNGCLCLQDRLEYCLCMRNDEKFS